MALAAGDKLGHYEILAPLGAGGMGEVYRARDTRLKRDVAIKILADAFARDPERMARFQREAEVLATLNHPNIAQIYGVEERALVMELVEGETLAGPLPLETAVDYSRQLADALEYAHEKAIVHRDLKPANVKITPEGKVKVLDFGLAKAIESDAPATNATISPTMTMRATQMGVLLGTAAYMSPEQARGKPVDKRADIWAFGVVLYEMLTGKQLFDGETITDVLAAVVNKEPNWELVPERARPLLKSCLEKDRQRRLRDIGDWRLAFGDARPVRTLPKRPLAWIAATAALALAVGGLGLMALRHQPPEPVLRLSVLPPNRATLPPALEIPAVSPDGRQVAFAAVLDGKTSLWIRDLGVPEPRQLQGTDGALLPFWSPDSRSIGFFANGKLKKTEAAGGAVITLCDSGSGRGGTWNQDGTIVFSPGVLTPLLRVSAAGGTPVPLTSLNDQEPAHRFPWFLPDGRHFLYTAYGTSREKDTVYVGDLQSQNRQRILSAASNAVYAAPGYLLYLKDRTLMAHPFDAGRLRVTGDAVPIAEQITYNALDMRGSFSASQNGVLVYGASGNVRNIVQLTWFDRTGKVTGMVGRAGAYERPALSPDGHFVAFEFWDSQTGFADINRYDLIRGAETRLTFNGENNRNPVWSPDSTQIAFFASPGGAGGVYRKAANGAGGQDALAKPAGTPDDWSSDGRYIIWHTTRGAERGSDIWVLPLFGDRKPFIFQRSIGNAGSAAKLSPDGKWLVYAAHESSRNEIFVQSFPTFGGKWQISTAGGDYPVWSRDGKELFYIAPDRRMMSVEVKTGPNFEAGLPKALFDAQRFGGNGFDVDKDGRFLIPVQMEQSTMAPLSVVVGWQSALQK